MRAGTRRILQFAVCVVLACSLSALADDDDDGKPAVTSAPASGASLTSRQQNAVGIVIARPHVAKLPDHIDAVGIVLDTATLVGDIGEMTAAEVAERSMKSEVTRLQALYAGSAGASLRTLEAARAEEAKAIAQSRFTVARFTQHWGPLASLSPADRQKSIESVARGHGLLLRADLPGRHSVGSLPDMAKLDVDGVQVPGRVLGIVGQSEEAQSVGLLIGVGNAPPGLGPGARVPIALMMAKRSGLLLPRDAILYDERGAYVFKQLSDGPTHEKVRYVRRNVTLLFGHGDDWLVEGVDDDDDIVVGGAGVLWSLEEMGSRVVDDDDDD
jgi:hypothetical protein